MSTVKSCVLAVLFIALLVLFATSRYTMFAVWALGPAMIFFGLAVKKLHRNINILLTPRQLEQNQPLETVLVENPASRRLSVPPPIEQ